MANRALGLMALWLTAYAAISIGARQRRLAHAMGELNREVDQRRRAEDQLRYLNETLEQRVIERTAERERAREEAQHEVDRHHVTQVALQSTEGQLAAVVAAAVDAIISIDERGTIKSINPAGERLFGYNAREVNGQNVKLLMPSPYREEHDGYLARYLETGDKRIIGIGREASGQRKDGTIFPLDLSVAEAWLGDDRIFVGIIRDITERKHAEDALGRSKLNLEQAVLELQAKNSEVRSMTQQLWQAAKLASVGELASSIAHELNNPLATMMLRLESLLEKNP